VPGRVLPPTCEVYRVLEVGARAGDLRGLRIVSEPPALRHFTARFGPM
jgi:tryptophanase